MMASDGAMVVEAAWAARMLEAVDWPEVVSMMVVGVAAAAAA